MSIGVLNMQDHNPSVGAPRVLPIPMKWVRLNSTTTPELMVLEGEGQDGFHRFCKVVLTSVNDFTTVYTSRSERCQYEVPNDSILYALNDDELTVALESAKVVH